MEEALAWPHPYPPSWTPSAVCHSRLGWRLRGELADILGKQEQLERKEVFRVGR